MFRTTVIIFLLFNSGLQILAQEFDYQSFGINEGLLTNEVYDIHQDSLGNMWFATDLGVSKYDGVDFKEYTTNNGLPHNVVFQIQELKGQFWFNTYKSGLCYLAGDTIIEYEFNKKLLEILGESYIQDFFVENGNLWFSITKRNGLYFISDSGDLKPYDFTNENATVYFKNLSFYTISGFNNLQYYAPSTIDIIYDSNATYVSFPKGISQDWLAASKPQQNGPFYSFSNYVLKNERGLLGNNTQRVLPYDILSIYQDNEDNLWVGTLNNGVLYFEKGKIELGYNKYLNNISISDIFQDSQGNLWFSSLERGVFLLKSFNDYSYNLSEKITEVKCFNDIIFCGTNNGIVYKIKDGDKQEFFKHRKEEGISDIKHIEIVENQYLLVEGKKISINNGDILKPQILDGRKLYEHHNEYLAVAYYGISLLDNYKEIYNSKNNTPPFTEKIKQLVSMNKDTLLVLSFNGLNVFYDNKVSPIRFNQIDNLEITNIAIWNKSQLLISTKNNGVFIINRHFKVVDHLTKKNGLSSDNCFALYVHNDSVFCLGTNKGLNIISKKTDKYGVRQCNATNNRIINQINDIDFIHGNFILATDNGLSIISEDVDSLIFNPTQIKRVSVNNIHQFYSNDLILNYNQRKVEISYVSPNYGKPSQLKYRYRLGNMDSSWNFTTSTSVLYSQIEPGEYRFEVQPFVNDSFGSIAFMEFKIKPHFTKTWWFITLIILIIIWIVYLIFMDMKIKEKYRRDAISAKQTALRSQMNPHFLFNALNSIQNYILRNEKELSVRYLNKFSNLIRKVLDNSMHNYITIKEDLDALEDYIALEKVRFEGQFEYQVIVQEGFDITEYKIPPLLLQPIVENAIWHGLIHKKEKKGLISIRFCMQGEDIICIIEDNGVGRKQSSVLEIKKKNYKSVGINITRDRLRIINSSRKRKIVLHIEDINPEQEETGTRVRLCLPK